MNDTFPLKNKISLYYEILWDIFFLLTFSLLTVYSHLLPVPLFILEPMRVIVLFSVLFTRKSNSYILALLLPLISYSISQHPPLIKSLLIVFELNVNILILHYLNLRMKNVFIVLISSIILSKLIYYISKFIVIYNLLDEKFEITVKSIFIQIVFVIILSGSLTFIFKFFSERKEFSK
jgi:hypothetical protein